ncbi:unnamed protein product, partial [Iphiclides podalirius]
MTHAISRISVSDCGSARFGGGDVTRCAKMAAAAPEQCTSIKITAYTCATRHGRPARETPKTTRHGTTRHVTSRHVTTRPPENVFSPVDCTRRPSRLAVDLLRSNLMSIGL